MITEKLKKSILNFAITGALSKQYSDEKCNITNVESINSPELFDIPNNWKWLKVRDVGDLVRGNGIKRNETVTSGIQCIRYGEIYTNYSYSFKNSISFVSENLAKSCRQVTKGDILLTLTGENEYDIAKATAYLGADKLVAGGDLAILTNHNQNPLYLSYYFASPFAITQKSRTAKGNIIVHTSTDKIGDYFIPLPPIEEQQRIVDKIEELFAKLDEMKPIEEELNKLKSKFSISMRKSLLSYFFKDDVDIKKEKLNKILSFSNIKNSESGEHKYLEVKYLRGNMEPKILKKGKYVTSGALAILMDGENSGEVFKIFENGYLGSTLKILNIKETVLEKYIIYYLMLKKDFFKSNKRGSAIPHLDKNLFLNSMIYLPSLEEQSCIVGKLEQLLPLCDDIEKIVNQ